METKTHTFNPHVSVDCVILGYDGTALNVLLIRQKEAGTDEFSTSSHKLPGSLIYNDEDIEEAARRVLRELTGLSHVKMRQFHAFGDVGRVDNPGDRVWIRHFHRLPQEEARIVTIGYLSLVRINRSLRQPESGYEPCWRPVSDLPQLAFDHAAIVRSALEAVRDQSLLQPSILFDLLPRKFTASQLFGAYCALTGKQTDFRNFHKKMLTMPYVMPLNEYEQGVSHRAARYFRFNRKMTS